LSISAVRHGRASLFAFTSEGTSAKARDQCSRRFPGVLKHSFPRTNAGAPTSFKRGREMRDETAPNEEEATAQMGIISSHIVHIVIWLCRPLKGTWFLLLLLPGTAVPGSGFFRPFRDWFAEGICGRTGLELCWKRVETTYPAGPPPRS
jgi:hypothetical protein